MNGSGLNRQEVSEGASIARREKLLRDKLGAIRDEAMELAANAGIRAA